MHGRPGTYSIVAVDTATGEVGVAVQSKYFCVGAVVPWARAGVGAVATQAAGVAGYGPRILELLAAGLEPSAAIEQALADDSARATRQLGVVDASGRSASYTGAECNDWAGDLQGDGFAVQGNILAGEAVVQGMASAFRESEGALADRLMAALEAAEVAGGDRRGRQSAAMIVERAGSASSRREGIDRILDLRVDDHPEPIEELRRLLGIWERWHVALASYELYEAGDYAGAIEATDRALERLGDDALLLYNRACYASLAGHRDDALDALRRALELDASMLEMARTDATLRRSPPIPSFYDWSGRQERPNTRRNALHLPWSTAEAPSAPRLRITARRCARVAASAARSCPEARVAHERRAGSPSSTYSRRRASGDGHRGVRIAYTGRADVGY